MAKKDKKTINVEMLFALVSDDADKAQKTIEAFAGTNRKNLTMDEASRVIIGIGIENTLNLDRKTIKDIIEKHQLGFDNRSEVVKILDDGVLVTKMRLKEFKKSFQTLIDVANQNQKHD